MKLESTEAVADTNWRIASIETPKVTTHAIFRPSKPPIVFGVDGEYDQRLATQMIRSIELSEIPVESCSAVPLATSVNGFDTLVAIHGSDRHFVCGWWIDEPDFIHLVPVYACELGPDNCFHYDRVRRYMNVFDLNRSPEPFLQFQMQGGASQLLTDGWAYASVRELMSYVSVLMGEADATLMLKNRVGDVLRFPHDTGGWIDIDSRILSHLKAVG